MGAYTSKPQETENVPKVRKAVFLHDDERGTGSLPIKKVAAQPPPPPPKKCSNEHACQMEEIEIAGLKKLQEMDDAQSKKLNVTSDTFEEYWSSITKNAKVLDALDIPEFIEERAKVAEAFSGKDMMRREEAMAYYKEAVDEFLTRIAKKNGAKKEEEAPPPPGPAKKK